METKGSGLCDDAGHASNPWNNRCDELAVIESKRISGLTQEEKKTDKNCSLCKEYVNGNCSAMRGALCEDYIPVYCRTSEEVWPEYGMATEIKMKLQQKER